MAASPPASGAGRSAAPRPDDVGLVERLAAALARDPADEATRQALRRLVDRERPVPAALGRRIRDILRDTVRSPTTTVGFPGEPGEPLIVSGVVLGAERHPVDGAVLYVFHADSSGTYTREAEMDEANARLFGYMRTGPDGRFELRTTRPGGYRKPYDGRLIPAHTHFEVTASGHRTQRLQLVFRDDPHMDAHWREWARKAGHPVVEVDRSGPEARCSVEIVLN